MKKDVLFYFVHAHGAGHKATFHMLYPALSEYFEVIAITTNHDITQWLAAFDVKMIELSPKYPEGYDIPEPTFSKAFEVTPYAAEPAQRAEAMAQAIITHKPVAFYCDGVPEIGIMARGMGVPVVLVHLPGNMMNDPTQVFAYELADHIITHFPEKLEQEDYAYEQKTFYSGYLSKYAGAPRSQLSDDSVTILLGYDTYSDAVVHAMTDNEFSFTIIGNTRQYAVGGNCRQLGRIDDIASQIRGDIIITAAGQNTVAELLSLHKKLILLPEPRPYDEQAAHTKMLVSNGLALEADEHFTSQQWRNIVEAARSQIVEYSDLVNEDGPRAIAVKMKEWYGTV